MNNSGVNPLDLRVVVLPDPVEQKTKGGIILPDETRDRQKAAGVKATLVAVGSNAWEEAIRRGVDAPTAGARVMIAKYGGIEFTGADGNTYRIMNDEDVIGLLTEEAA